MMFPLMEWVFISRAVERVLIILVAALCIYLGFRLLLAMPKNRTGEGKVTLPLGGSIILSRLGPGAFFALFGCVILVLSLRHALTVNAPLEREPQRQTASAASRGSAAATSFTYLQPRDTPLSQEFDWLPPEVLDDLFLLNQMPSALRGDIDPKLRADLEQLAVRGKLLVLHPHWQNSWGSEIAFREWAATGSGNPPDDCDEPARLFNHGRLGP